MKSPNRLLERNIFLGFGSALVLVAALCVTLYYNASHFLEMNSLVEHTHRVIEETGEIYSATKTVESDTRGYVISGDEMFLENYTASVEEINSHLDSLRKLTADNPHQQQRLDLLEPYLKSKIAFSGYAIETRRRGESVAAQKLIAFGKGKTDMDRIGDIIASIKQEENDLMTERSANSAASEYHARLALIVFGVLVLILFLITYLFIRRDLKDRNSSEREIRSREELYRALVRSIPKTAVVLFDMEMRYTLADGAELKEQNFTQEMFEGKTLREAFPPEISEKWSDYYSRALDGEQIVLENAANGKFHQIYILPVRNGRGEIFSGMVMWQDITERKQNENALRESEQRYRDLIDKSPGLICAHDADGILLLVNPAAARSLGFEPPEVIGKSLEEFLSPESKPFFGNYLDQLRNHGKAIGEMGILSKTGEKRVWQYSNVLYSKNEDERFFLGYAQDITEMKRTEAELRESCQMFQQFMNNSPALIYMKDAAGKYDFQTRTRPPRPRNRHRSLSRQTNQTIRAL